MGRRVITPPVIIRRTGQDYACEVGTKVVAPAKSVIVAAGWGPWGTYYGYQVVGETTLDGVKIQWSTCHMSHISVHAGVTVAEGQQIGLSGNTGNTTGPHVHYEERTTPFRYANQDIKPRLASQTNTPKDDPKWGHGDVYVRMLHNGAKDSDSVRRLQQRLIDHVRVPAKGLKVTGNWDDHTHNAVRYWQKQVFAGQKGPRDGDSMSNGQANALFGPAFRVIENRPRG